MEELHTEIEAQKLAYADLHRFVADPRFAKVPVEGMLSMAYARERAKPIDVAKARCDVAPALPPLFTATPSIFRRWTATATSCR